MTSQCLTVLHAWQKIWKGAVQKGGIGHDIDAQDTILILAQALREQATEVYESRKANVLQTVRSGTA